MMAPLTEPPYCLVYPIHFFNATPTDLRNQLHMDLFPPHLCCQECVCHWLIQWANLHEKWETIMGGSRFLLPHMAQYDDNLLPWLMESQKPPRGPRHSPALSPGQDRELHNAILPVSWHCGRQLHLLGRCAEVARGKRLPSSEIYRAQSTSTPHHQHLYQRADQWCD